MQEKLKKRWRIRGKEKWMPEMWKSWSIRLRKMNAGGRYKKRRRIRVEEK